MKKYILIAIAICFVIGVSVGLYLYNMKAKDFAHSKPSVIVTVDEIYRQFNGDEVAATTKYVVADKVVQVSGILKEATTDSDSITTLVLSDLNNADEMVSITLEEKNLEIAKNLPIGLLIVVNGQCTGMLDDFVTKKVQMIRGGIIK